jgi:hypothetical protein
MNNHLPSREWIFEEEPLPADSKRMLQMHLEQCAECQALAQGWLLAETCLKSAAALEPREGFTARWKALARDRLRSPSPRPAWALLAASSVGALAMATALAFQTSTQGLSLAGVFTRDLTAATGVLNDWSDASQAVGGFFRTVSQSIPPACYLFAVFFLSLAAILWLLIFVRARSRGEKR